MWDKMVQNDVMRRHDALYVDGAGGLLMPQVGVRGASSRKFFVNISSKKAILGQL